MSLAWESASPVPCLSLWERWPSAARTERANKKEPPSGDSFSLSINPLYGVRGSSTQGELEGAKPASNQIKCRAKPCLARRAWSEATIFVPQGGTKITTLFQAVEKAGGFFDSLKEREATGLPLFSCLPKKSVIPSRRSRRRGNPFFFASGGLFSFSSERKEEKKRRQKLRFWISLRAFARSLSRLFYHANAVPWKFPLNVALSLLLFSLPLLL